MIKLAFDSPGCTLAPMITYFLYLKTGASHLSSNSFRSISMEAPLGYPCSLLTWDVIVSSGTSSPLSE